ncbi:MAG: hypothetical protein JSV58_07385 [Candidatus Bathyarchaeota archaeon]|nr:MAG: hypothetical protein JSV58_07385 [Candidatus Bathyarchaeota archaeon]
MRAEATICLSFPSERWLRVVCETLKPETRLSTQRSKVQVERDGRTLIMELKADDTSALRAAANSYLRWVLLARSIIDCVDELTSAKVETAS